MTKTKLSKGCRDMTKCFANGQRIRHAIGNKIWIGIYDSSQNGIICNKDEFFKSLSGFVETHYSIYRTYRRSADGKNVNMK